MYQQTAREAVATNRQTAHPAVAKNEDAFSKTEIYYLGELPGWASKNGLLAQLVIEDLLRSHHNHPALKNEVFEKALTAIPLMVSSLAKHYVWPGVALSHSLYKSFEGDPGRKVRIVHTMLSVIPDILANSRPEVADYILNRIVKEADLESAIFDNLTGAGSTIDQEQLAVFISRDPQGSPTIPNFHYALRRSSSEEITYMVEDFQISEAQVLKWSECNFGKDPERDGYYRAFVDAAATALNPKGVAPHLPLPQAFQAGLDKTVAACTAVAPS